MDELAEGWIVWGRYGCSHCGRIGLHHVPDRPDVILLDGQRFIPRRVHTI
ncbi:MAG: hypothetical protein AB7T31_14355 [Gemmatimonadales bacterium]